MSGLTERARLAFLFERVKCVMVEHYCENCGRMDCCGWGGTLAEMKFRVVQEDNLYLFVPRKNFSDDYMLCTELTLDMKMWLWDLNKKVRDTYRGDENGE